MSLRVDTREYTTEGLLIDMSRNLRVLHVAETVRGGIATYFNELHPLQVAEFGPENVAYVVPAHHRGDLTEIPDASIVAFGSRGRTALSFCAMAFTALREVVRRRPDVVHLHSTFAGAVLRPLLALLPGRPTIVYCPHGWAFSRDVSRPSRAATRAVERMLAAVTDQIVCISDSEQGAARESGVGAGRLALVRNGIARSRPLDAAGRRNADRADGRLRVLFVGRLDRQKGFDLLIAAASELTETVSVRLVGSKVVGGGALADLPANVEILDWMPRARIEDAYDWADIVVMPSRWEGFGLVALEAMRAGRPVLAFRTGALGEIVVDGQTGILCASPDIAGLVADLRRAMTLDLSGMGRRGAERFRDLFSIERTHRGLLKAYGSALARRRVAGPVLAVAASRQK